jgi:hypothetical protein
MSPNEREVLNREVSHLLIDLESAIKLNKLYIELATKAHENEQIKLFDQWIELAHQEMKDAIKTQEKIEAIRNNLEL